MNCVTAVIPTMNRRDLIERVLGSLREQTLAVDALVVDNGSTDGTEEAALALGARVIRLERNEGFAIAVNRGIRSAHTPYVAVLNNDVLLHPEWCARLKEACERTGAAFATGRTLSAADATRLDGSFDLLARSGCAWRAGSGWPDGPEWRAERAIRFAPLTAALFRSSVFSEAGLLDEDFGSYLEDVEFGLRCALAGCGGMYVPDAVAWHQGSATRGAWHSSTVYSLSRNQVLLVSRHYSLRRFLWPILAGQALWGLVALRHGAIVPWFQGKRDGVRWAAANRIPPAAGPRAAAIVAESEAEMRTLQKGRQADVYWRVYFAVTRGG
jgi:GT2 family glycosyltransferase